MLTPDLQRLADQMREHRAEAVNHDMAARALRQRIAEVLIKFPLPVRNRIAAAAGLDERGAALLCRLVY